MKKQIIILLFVVAILPTQLCFAEATSAPANSELNIFRDFDYPELQVVPRASDKLAVEAQTEDENRLMNYWPLEVSALSTLVTGAMTRGRYGKDPATEDYKRDADNASLVAAGVGAGWLGVIGWLAYQEPSQKSLVAFKKMKAGDKRSELARERFAEEALERNARTMKIVTYASVLTNLGASYLVSTYASADSKNYAFASAAFSILPLFFQNSAITAYEKNQEYKHKIYAPITWLDWNARAREWTPQVAVRAEF